MDTPIVNPCEKYMVHQADPIQNMLAPYIREFSQNLFGLPVKMEYVTVQDAYMLIKRALESRLTSEG